MFENDPLFEDRKKDHIRESLDKVNQVGISPSDEVFLEPRALPEIDFKDVSLKVCIFSDKYVEAPVFVSSMTAGHDTSEGINYRLAQACYRKNWALAVGSQRRELFSENQKNEWLKIRSDFPGLVLLGNIGLAQVIHTPMEEILKLIENLGASALFVHLNSLQEALQAEGTPFFKGGLDKLKKISKESPVPILVKETGCGMSKVDLKNLFEISSLYAVDVSGFGGTHWGRIEGRRNLGTKFDRAAQVYKNWGLTTAQSLEYCEQLRFTMGAPLRYWASGVYVRV